MQEQPIPSSTFRFGVFHLDTQTGELHKQGRLVRLQHQPFRVLVALLENPGMMVSREDLKQRIWPNDNFGDFDHAVNVAVAKIRAALSDDADSPRFVETLPRRGYRFIFPVQGSNGHAPAEAGVPSSRLEDAVFSAESSSVAVQQVLHGATSDASRRSIRPYLLAGIAAIVIIAIGIGRFARPKPPKVSERDTLVLSEFTNNTGDAVFDRTLKRGLAIALAQSPYLRTLSDDEVEKTLGYMKRPVDTELTPEIAREVCKRTSSAATLDGVIDRVGSQYVVAVTATNCQSGERLGQTEVHASDQNAVLDALGKASSQIRHQLGESLASVKKSDKPLIEVSTSSIEALRAYTLWNYEQNDDASFALLRRAVELDPHFALAYLQMADMYTAHGEAGPANENLKKAYEFRTQASELERLIIESRYEEHVTGDMERAHELYALRSRLFPEDPSASEGVSGFFVMLGDFDKALLAMLDATKIDPDRGADFGSASLYAIFANRLDEARSLNVQAKAKGSRDLASDYLLAFLVNDSAAMQDIAKASEGTSEEIVSMDSDSEARIGHLTNANRLASRTVEFCLKKKRPEEAAEYQLNIALRQAEFGNGAEAKKLSEAALALSPTRDVKIIAAIALARAGFPDQAERLADEIDKLNPKNTQVQKYWLPTARAAIALKRKKPQQAVDALRSAAELEIGLIYPTIEVNCLLYPVFLRGEAFLQLHRPEEAIAEYLKFFHNPTLVLNNPLSALAGLQLARANVMKGNLLQARANYRDFLHLWSDADPDLAPLKEAQAEVLRTRR
jgi:eukaryotic-like serine/threonine-protein kinase